MSARILVVEDNPVTRKMFRVTLQIEGYTVLEAPDARTALRLMAEGRPDLVVLDLILPDLDGFDLVPLLRERPGGAEVPIIACSGFLSRLEATRVSALGLADFLIKPVEPARLVRIIQGFLPARGVGVAASGEGRLVLAVDDDPVQLRVMRFHLERLGFRVTTASNGAEALVAARQALPEAIVSDVLMPGLDGFQLCLAIRREPRLAHIPVVLASASYVEEADRALARKVGASRLVFRAPDCREAIEALLQSLRGLVARPEAPDAQLEQEHFHRKVRQLERQVTQNAALVQRTSFQAAVLSMLGKLSSALARGAETGIAPADLLASLLDVGGLSTGALFLWDADGRLALAGHHGYPDEAVGALADFCGHLGRAAGELTEGAVVAVPSSGLPAATDFLAQLGMKSALLVPLVSRDERIGVLLLASRLRDLLDPDWSAFAQTIGAQISQTVGLGRVFARLAAAEEQYRGLFENAAEGIFQTSVEGRALIANPALARILGYDSPEELVARVTDVARQLYTDPARRDELLRRVQEEGAVSGFEMPARRKDGSTVWLSVSARAVRGPDGTVLHLEGRAEDITARKRAQETAAALAEVGRELVATLDFAQVAERVVSTVARVFRVRRAGLYRLDPVSRTLTCIAIAGEGDPGPWLGRVLPTGVGAAGRAVAEGRAAPSPDIPTVSLGPLPEWLVERFQAEGLRSGAGAPLIARGKTLGALDLADRAGRVFTEGELGLLSVFADQAAAALQNAELYEEAERRRHAAEVLADLGRLVSQSLDLTEVRQRVVDGVRELLGGHSAVLLRIDQESGDLVTTAASGEREIFGVTPVLPRGTGASGLAVRERRPVASPDMLADDRFTVSAEIRTLAERASCRAVLAVPLSMQERVVGVLNVSGLTGRIFGE